MVHDLDMRHYNRFSIWCQVQIQVIQKRQKEKKAMMTAVKKYQKGAFKKKKKKNKSVDLCVCHQP